MTAENDSCLFSVVIPTCDRPEALRACLDAFSASVLEGGARFEVIVSNDGHGDPLVDLLPYPEWLIVTRGPRRGPAANRNHAAHLAHGEWIVFVDDDCVPEAGWLRAYQDAIRENPGTEAFEGAIVPQGDMSFDLADCPVNENGGLFWSANVCVKRATFEALGGFDEAYLLPAHEDQDLYIRLQRRTRVPFVRGARVTHPVRRLQLWKVLRDIDKRNAAWIHFATKNAEHLGYAGKVGILSAGYASQVRGLVHALRRGHPKKAIYHTTMLTVGMSILAARLCFATSA